MNVCNLILSHRTCHQDLYLNSVTFNSLHFVSFDYTVCIWSVETWATNHLGDKRSGDRVRLLSESIDRTAYRTFSALFEVLR